MPKNPEKFKIPVEKNSSPEINEVIDIMDKWFWWIEDGTADNRFPSPAGSQVTMEEADKVISFIDKQINHEVTTHVHYFGEQRGMDVPADFNRLKGLSRIAFVQELLDAKERLNIGRNSAPLYPTAYG